MEHQPGIAGICLNYLNDKAFEILRGKYSKKKTYWDPILLMCIKTEVAPLGSGR
jgi:hypothetical protein